LHASRTSAGLETRYMGAQIAGIVRRARSAGSRLMLYSCHIIRHGLPPTERLSTTIGPDAQGKHAGSAMLASHMDGRQALFAKRVA
jgi:hypothetical protein